MRIKTLSVSEVNRYIKNILSGDIILNNLSVRGEISNLRLVQQSNAYFFNLKDSYAAIQCIMFMDVVDNLKFIPSDGMEVAVHGKISLYERNGSYSINVDNMEPCGVGAYYIALNNLKEKLRSEGLFDREHKRQIPEYPRKIGIITSINGAVIHDILKIISDRYPCVDIDIYPITVQGDRAADDICTAFEIMNDLENIDLIILARGGGSVEDLWPFNEEKVARAIYSSRYPVISAVGHETNFTIADFVADARAATPTEAAAMAVPDMNSIMERIEKLEDYMTGYIDDLITVNSRHLEFVMRSSPLLKPDMFFERYNVKLTQQREFLIYHIMQFINKRWMDVESLDKRLGTLNPLSVLKRGFAVLYDENKSLITDVDMIKVDDEITIRLYNGIINCRVEEVNQIE